MQALKLARVKKQIMSKRPYSQFPSWLMFLILRIVIRDFYALHFNDYLLFINCRPQSLQKNELALFPKSDSNKYISYFITSINAVLVTLKGCTIADLRISLFLFCKCSCNKNASHLIHVIIQKNLLLPLRYRFFRKKLFYKLTWELWFPEK